MIPSFSTPLSPPDNDYLKRPLSANLSTPAGPTLAQRRRNNKNLSLCLPSSSTNLVSTLHHNSSSSTTIHSATSSTFPPFVPPSTPFLPSHETQSKYVDGPVMILPGVYLGDESNSLDLARLKDLSIQCMMNVAAEVQHPSAALFSPWHALDDEGAATSKTSMANSTDSTNSTHSNTTMTHPCPTLSTSSSSTTSSYHSYHTTISSASSGMTLAPASSSSSSKVPMAHDDQLPSPMYYKKRPWHHHIQDNNDADVIQELHAAVIDIAHARQANKRVLVHCQCGLARSATVLIAYVMYTKQLTMQAALAHVKHRATHINPNFSLMYHLREYEQWLRNTYWVQTPHTFVVPSPTTIPASPTTPSTAIDPSAKKLKTTTSSSLAAKWKSFKQKSSASPLRTSWWRHPTTPITASFSRKAS